MSQSMETQLESFVATRLRDALCRLGLTGGPPLAPLFAAYQAGDRFYHNLGHVGDCLEMAATLGSDDPRIIVALVYHDAVYDSRAKDNEERSAEWARRDLTALGATAALCGEITRLILSTAHRSPPVADDEKLIVDVDLSILGRDLGAYDAYAANVRREFAWVSEADWRKGRGQFLRGMLARPQIFSTETMRGRWENRARENLARELGLLGG